MARPQGAPFDETSKPLRRITPVTRRDIFDFLRTDGAPWSGRLDEVSFLDRLYDLDELPNDGLSRRTVPERQS